MWNAISPEAREEWAIRQAARAECVRDAAKLFVTFDNSEGRAIKEDIKMELEPLLVHFGNVPAHRCDEVFDLAESTIRQELDADGQA